MKVRSGFVSNSSSSSFVCDVCGNEQSGMDLCLSDAEMFQCVNGHTICESHRVAEVALEAKRKLILDNKYSDDEQIDAAENMSDADFAEFWDDNNLDSEFELDYEAPEETCPVCQFKSVDMSEVARYFMRKEGIPKESMPNYLKAEFGEYSKFKEFIK